MLRKLTLNRKVIPIPVPLQTLGEAVQWIGDTLLLPGHSITRLTVNGADHDFAADSSRRKLIEDRRLTELMARIPIATLCGMMSM